ncbi:MAG: hypothetical protein OEY89_10220 [Gammaproteobacteria bacterium]|nr:hypothetical protein [Gammaproteobacteria bacterium]
MTLKQRFIHALQTGQLGETTEAGTFVHLKDFKAYFKDIETDYIYSFLPSAVIETGQQSPTHNRFLFRIAKGLYRVHPDVLKIEYRNNSGRECS